MTRRRHRAGAIWGRAAPPGWLEPVLLPIERLERRLRHIRSIRQRGLLGVEFTRYRGDSIFLADGTCVKPGDLIGELHFNNRRVRELGEPGWQLTGNRVAREDLARLAAWFRAQPADRRPVAYHAETILGPLARRAGFEVSDAPSDRLHRLRAWYLRGLLARWSPKGRRRLAQGRGGLRLWVMWLSDAQLRRRFSGAMPASSFD